MQEEERELRAGMTRPFTDLGPEVVHVHTALWLQLITTYRCATIFVVLFFVAPSLTPCHTMLHQV